MTELTVLPVEVSEIAKKLPESKQQNVQAVFNSIFTGTSKWKNQLAQLEITSVDDITGMKIAEEIRLSFKRARLSAKEQIVEERDKVKMEKSRIRPYGYSLA